MILLNDFFEITEIDDSINNESIIIDIKLNPNHKIFDGHFPEMPVVPGVFIIQMLKEILIKLIDKEVQLEKISNVKFQNILSPAQNTILNFDIKIKKEENRFKISSKIYYENIIFCSIKGEFK